MTVAPQFARFSGESVLLVGSGSLAATLMLRLIGAGARVRWFAEDPDVAEEISLSGHPDRIAIALREPRHAFNVGDGQRGGHLRDANAQFTIHRSQFTNVSRRDV